MEKVIHYCWFGGNPLPKMAKKCIKSWKKYLPDYKIIEWNEENFDVNITPFVKQAYENKKWAFVSDYARLYALYRHGGIYFDTDMEVLKNIDDLLEKEFFIGNEEDNMIAAGVIGVKEKHNRYIKELIEFYDSQEDFNINMIYDYAIPKIITNIFKKYPKEIIENGIEVLDKSIYIYPEDYFYPINYNYSKKNYTDNTCMIHYYNASWTPKQEKFIIGLYRTFGVELGNRIYKILHIFSNIKKRIYWRIKRNVDRLKMKASIHLNQNKRVRKVKGMLEEQQGQYVTIYHPDWIGISNATKDSFVCKIPLREQYTKKEAYKMAKTIVDSNKKLVIFNGFANGWDQIAKSIKEIDNKIVIKILWHGGNALLSEEYDWNVFINILNLYDTKVIDELGFVKKSMAEFYAKKGYKASFVMNTVKIEEKEQYIEKEGKNTNKLRVGLYSSGDRWVKNTYNQLSAVSLLEDVKLDCVPINCKVIDLARRFKLEVTGEENNVTRDEMFRRMSKNNINIYVTFTECAPLIPLESLELGVPCITGDNHHYFENTALEEYLIVKKEDNIIEIYNQINKALENKDKILELYNDWKKEYDIQAKQSVETFVKI